MRDCCLLKRHLDGPALQDANGLALEEVQSVGEQIEAQVALLYGDMLACPQSPGPKPWGNGPAPDVATPEGAQMLDQAAQSLLAHYTEFLAHAAQGLVQVDVTILQFASHQFTCPACVVLQGLDVHVLHLSGAHG